MSNGKPPRQPLFWEGSAKRDFKAFPESVQKDMGVALFVVQLGGTPRADVALIERRLKAVVRRYRRDDGK